MAQKSTSLNEEYGTFATGWVQHCSNAPACFGNGLGDLIPIVRKGKQCSTFAWGLSKSANSTALLRLAGCSILAMHQLASAVGCLFGLGTGSNAGKA